jgi:phosphatidylglycerophosphate synthase
LDTNNFSRVVPHPFGLANWVTLIRAVIALLFLGLGLAAFGGGVILGPSLRWIMVTGAATSLGLDGVDGYLARRLGQASAFGARFDMETDALTMLALAILVWALGQTGAWVLLSGLMRYIFIVGGWLWPALAMPLPPRKRRQRVCVAQMIALILALAPAVMPFWAAVICLAGLFLLGYSFGADLAWLAGRGKLESEAVS